MVTVTITQLYKLLSEKTDEQTAEALTSYVVQKIESEVENQTDGLATAKDLATAKGELKAEMYKIKADSFKWVVGLFITQILTMVGLFAGLYFR